MDRVTQRLSARSRRTSAMLVLRVLFGGFQERGRVAQSWEWKMRTVHLLTASVAEKLRAALVK
jgi:hypothetical protein